MTRSEILQIAKPILFNTEMVRAILDGRKTVTRRVIKFPQNKYTREVPNPDDITVYERTLSGEKVSFHIEPFYCMDIKKPYKPGDYLYVREAWERFQCVNCDGDETGKCFNGPPDSREGCYVYRATTDINGDARWRPSIHMPKEAARIFLRVTGVRVERLKEIENGWQFDKEGIVFEHGFISEAWRDFQRLWDSTIPPKDRDKYGWAANPWVFVIEFERVEVTE